MSIATSVLLCIVIAGCGAGRASAAPPDDDGSIPAATGAPATITVEASGFRNAKGKALFALFTRAKGFPDGAYAARRVAVTIEDGKAQVSFRKLPAGTYAVAVLHDENDNKKMDTNFMGIPTEGYGASNNAKNRFSPPDWDDARFTVEAGKTVTQRIKMIYH